MSYVNPKKEIHTKSDMAAWDKSPAKRTLSMMVDSLSRLVTGIHAPTAPKTPIVIGIISVLDDLQTWAEEIEPLTNQQRFGNARYRDWAAKVTENAPKMLRDRIQVSEKNKDIWNELDHYFVNAFGSQQRIDFGTGHELNFLAFWGGLLLREPELSQTVNGEETLALFSKYFDTCRKVILRYNLEPAGSHGVWGLDDHFHLPYILGAAQLKAGSDLTPKDILDRRVVSQEAPSNMYFAAIDFIYKVKRGNFAEHSPILYDISGVPTWSKIHSGVTKMYNVEVLGKYPVIQHFEFGSIYTLL